MLVRSHMASRSDPLPSADRTRARVTENVVATTIAVTVALVTLTVVREMITSPDLAEQTSNS